MLPLQLPVVDKSDNRKATMLKNLWTAEMDGSKTSDIDDFRLEVRDVGGMARFLVLRQAEPGTSSRELLGSGSQANERSAMTAAQNMVEQIRRSNFFALSD